MAYKAEDFVYLRENIKLEKVTFKDEGKETKFFSLRITYWDGMERYSKNGITFNTETAKWIKDLSPDIQASYNHEVFSTVVMKEDIIISKRNTDSFITGLTLNINEFKMLQNFIILNV